MIHNVLRLGSVDENRILLSIIMVLGVKLVNVLCFALLSDLVLMLVVSSCQSAMNAI